MRILLVEDEPKVANLSNVGWWLKRYAVNLSADRGEG